MGQTIKRGVRAGGKLFRTDATDDEKQELDGLLTEDEVNRLKENGVLAGDFTGKAKVKEGEPRQTASVGGGAPGPARAQGVDRSYGEDAEVEVEREPAGGEGEELPGGFPARMQLVKAGYDTTEKVKEASDEDLAELDGVGEATVKKIREQLK